MRGRRWLLVVLAVCAVFSVPSPAYADMGVPMIGVALPGMIVMLAPVILLEVVVLMRVLGIAFGRAATVATVANTVSTVAGIPVTWGILVGLQAITGGGGAAGPGLETLAGRFLAVTWQDPWLMPYESDLYWMVPVAMLVLLVPFFFASWLIEHLVGRAMCRDLEAGAVGRAVLRANLVSYALLILLVLGGLGIGIVQRAGI